MQYLPKKADTAKYHLSWGGIIIPIKYQERNIIEYKKEC